MTFVASTLKAQRGKGGGGIGPEETLVAQEACRDDGNAWAEVRRSSFASPADSHQADPERDRVSGGEGDGGSLELLPTVAAPLSHGSNPNSNMAGRRREDDENLVSFDAEMSNQDEPSKNAYLTRKLRRAIASETTGVRRLTPRECERLQALPDDWTARGPDSRRYAALGDAVTASVAEWIGRRIVSGAAE